MKKRRDLERLLVDNPAEFTRKGLGVLRARAMTGSADAALTLRALSALADPEGAAKMRGKPKKRGERLHALALYLKRSILAVKAGTHDWYDPILRDKIVGLRARPSLGFERWFEVGWELYMASLDGNLENDPPMWDLACKAVAKGATSKGHGEKHEAILKKRLKAAARGCW
jgi:hypothetical protein